MDADLGDMFGDMSGVVVIGLVMVISRPAVAMVMVTALPVVKVFSCTLVGREEISRHISIDIHVQC